MIEETSWQPEAARLGFTSEEQMLRVLYLEQGLSLSRIAKLIGYSTFTIKMRLERSGVVLRGRGGCNTDKVKRALVGVEDDLLFHSSVAELVQEFGVHPSTVSAERRRRLKVKREREVA